MNGVFTTTSKYEVIVGGRVVISTIFKDDADYAFNTYEAASSQDVTMTKDGIVILQIDRKKQ